MEKCSVINCSDPVVSEGLCKSHLDLWEFEQLWDKDNEEEDL